MLDRGIAFQMTSSTTSSPHPCRSLNTSPKQSAGNIVCASKRKLSCGHSNLRCSVSTLVEVGKPFEIKTQEHEGREEERSQPRGHPALS